MRALTRRDFSRTFPARSFGSAAVGKGIAVSVVILLALGRLTDGVFSASRRGRASNGAIGMPAPACHAAGRGDGRYSAVVQRRFVPLTVALVALLGAAPGQAARKKKRPPDAAATPTPVPLLKAAGSCIAWVPRKHLILAEVGTTGRDFRVDASTEVAAKVRVGARIRILYVEGPEGPVAQEDPPRTDRGPSGAGAARRLTGPALSH